MTEPPDLTPEDGWTPIEPFPVAAVSAGRFVSGDRTEGRFRIAWFRRGHDDAIVGKAWFGPETEGPPGHAHGGAIAALLDECLGAVGWANGHRIVSGRLTVDFRKSLKLPGLTRFEGWLVEIENRKVQASARLCLPGGEIIAEADALLVQLTDEQLARFTSGD